MGSQATGILKPWARLGQDLDGLSMRVELKRSANSILFSFHLSCTDASQFDRLAIQSEKKSYERRRLDELWKHSCFELFISPSDKTSYLEMNLSPGGDWNIYEFSDYRAGMRPLSNAVAPLTGIEESRVGNGLEKVWRGEIGLEHELDLLEVSATCVLEYQDGTREYWALKHGGEKPDFHLRNSFVLRLK